MSWFGEDPRREYVPYAKSINHTYHGLSPNQATKLLKDYEEEAKTKIIRSMHIRSNVFEAAVVFFDDNPATLDKTFRAKFILNGEEFLVKETMAADLLGDDHALYEKLFKIVAERITIQLLEKAVAKKGAK